MSPTERREMIRKENTKLSLTRQCKLLKISRSSLYCAPVGVNDETLKLMNEIDCVFTKYPFFGSRHRVRRLMGLMGLQAIYRGPNTRCPAAHAKHV
jgi:putative transposase